MAVDGAIIAVALLAAYLLLVFWLTYTKRLEKWNLSLMLGIVLMVRTNRGKALIDAIARPRRFWNAFADVGTVITLLGMVGMTAFFIYGVWETLKPGSLVPVFRFSEILVIPGVNPFVPLWYGIVALIVTLVVHEGGHGVLARANDMKLKSLGLLFAVVPIGAFVEPEELDLKVASRRARLRVFSAGPAVNLAFALVSLVAFAGLVGAVQPTVGAHVAGPTAGGPFQKAGIEPFTTIVAVDGTPVANEAGLLALAGRPVTKPCGQNGPAAPGTHRPGDTVGLADAAGKSYAVLLDSKWDALSESDRAQVTARDPACAEELQASPHMGVELLDRSVASALGHPFTSGRQGLQLFLALPVMEVGLGGSHGSPYLSQYLPHFYATPFSGAVFWPLATVVFWIFWINLMVGLTNILPMMPLDGGHIFRDAVGGVVQATRPAMPSERRDRIVGLTATAVSLVILSAFLLQIFGPRVIQAFH